jgi:hypothetical protein
MTRKSKAQYQTDLDATIGTNGSGGITGTIANDRYEDLKDSAMWWDEGPVPAWYVGLATFTPALTDIVASVDDPGGTPVNGKLTLQSVYDLFLSTGGAPAAFIGSGTFANARISLDSVKQHEAELTILSSQIPDLPDGVAETDPLVGAVDGLVKSNGSGVIEAAVPGTDYLSPAEIGSAVQGFDEDTLKSDETRALTAGYTTVAHNIGTVSSGTVTPSFATRNSQRLVNNGAFTLAPPNGEGSMILKITNGATPGAITTSGFSSPVGNVFTTTPGHVFWCSIAVIDGESLLNVIADSRNV